MAAYAKGQFCLLVVFPENILRKYTKTKLKNDKNLILVLDNTLSDNLRSRRNHKWKFFSGVLPPKTFLQDTKDTFNATFLI